MSYVLYTLSNGGAKYKIIINNYTATIKHNTDNIDVSYFGGRAYCNISDYVCRCNKPFKCILSICICTCLCHTTGILSCDTYDPNEYGEKISEKNIAILKKIAKYDSDEVFPEEYEFEDEDEKNKYYIGKSLTQEINRELNIEITSCDIFGNISNEYIGDMFRITTYTNIENMYDTNLKNIDILHKNSTKNKIIFNFKRIISAESILNYNSLYSGGSNKKDTCHLFEIKDNLYVYAGGSSVYIFKSKSKIIKLISSVGNSAVIYPWAYDIEGNCYKLECGVRFIPKSISFILSMFYENNPYCDFEFINYITDPIKNIETNTILI
jgi:hypothetical protein